MNEESALTPEEIAEGEYFDRLYGPWESFDPAQVAEFLEGFDHPWWIVGGWAIDAFTGSARDHEDVDVSLLSCDVPALREHVGDRWQLWNIYAGTLRPLIDRWPNLIAPDSQVWVRRDRESSWVMDMPLTPDRDGMWTNKRLPDDDARPVDDVTWVADDGIRYLSPEITLLFKAKLDRPKDRLDRDRTWSLLDGRQRSWLRDAVRRMEPDHAWLPTLA